MDTLDQSASKDVITPATKSAMKSTAGMMKFVGIFWTVFLGLLLLLFLIGMSKMEGFSFNLMGILILLMFVLSLVSSVFAYQYASGLSKYLLSNDTIHLEKSFAKHKQYSLLRSTVAVLFAIFLIIILTADRESMKMFNNLM